MSDINLKQAFIAGAQDTLRAARRDLPKVKDAAIEVAYGVGDAVHGAFIFPQVALQYITGTSGRLGQLNPWSRFGSRYEDDGFDSPTTRTVEIFNHMVYGTLDLLSGHLLYSGARAMGIEHHIPYFSPPPTTIRGFASDLTNVAFVAVMPEAARVVKTQMGIPAKVVPVSEGSVFKELVESAERAKYAADMARGQARLAAMRAEMVAAAQDGAVFDQWATHGERGAIILTKPKPINWIVLGKTYPLDPFLDAVKQRFAFFKSEVIRRLDSGKSGPQILEWYNATVMPELVVLLETIKQRMNSSEDAGRVLHNFRNRISNLYGLLPMFLEDGSLPEVRILCAPPGSSLTSVVTALLAKYENVAQFETRGLAGVCFAPHVNLDVVMQVFENLLQNAVEHRRVNQTVAQVQFRFAGSVLAVVDKGQGMCEAQLERVNAGIRSHDGKLVEADTPETQGHGFGIQTVHQLAAEVGVQVVYSSLEGEHTTAALIAREPGIFVPDAMTYVFTNEGNLGHLETMLRGLSAEQRIQLVHALSKISIDVMDTFFSKYMELIEARQDPTPAVDIARRILTQYAPYLDMLVGDDPIVQVAPATQVCYKLVRNLREFVAQYSDFTPAR